MSELRKALHELGKKVAEDHPRLGFVVRVAAELTDEENREKLAREIRTRGDELKQQVIDAAINGRRR